MSTSSKKPESKNQGTWLNLLIWASLALILRWQVIEPRWIPSGSMLPTLEVQDRILVEKLSPRLNQKLNKHLKPETVVVFYPPQALVDAGYDSNSALIKRIVGISGDQIEVHEGNLFRNGRLVQESWREAQISYEMSSITVPENSLWVLGDNRNNSLDSHLWGPLPEENVIGTAVWRYWPLTKIGPIRFPALNKT